jgi:Na+/glutamate symporter
LQEINMSDGMVIAVIATNLALAAMTLGVVVACVIGGCKAAWKANATHHEGHPASA